MEDPRVIENSARHSTTRAYAAVETAAQSMSEGIYVVGNAPTALLHLIELVQGGHAAPALVVGLPVGFVNAAESKKILAGMNLAHITNNGRKGGSAVAAAV